jgi:hypothetical protein
MTLRRMMEARYEDGHRDGLRSPCHDPGLSESPAVNRYGRWAYNAGFADARREVDRKAAEVNRTAEAMAARALVSLKPDLSQTAEHG